MFLVLCLLGLHSVDVDIVLVLADFALEIVAVDADPLSVIVGFER